MIGSTIDFLSTEAGNRVLRERLNLNRTAEDMGQRFLVAKVRLPLQSHFQPKRASVTFNLHVSNLVFPVHVSVCLFCLNRVV